MCSTQTNLWSLSGDFNHRYREVHRTKLFVPGGTTFSIPLKYIDVMRPEEQASTTLPKNTLRDSWIDERERKSCSQRSMERPVSKSRGPGLQKINPHKPNKLHDLPRSGLRTGPHCQRSKNKNRLQPGPDCKNLIEKEESSTFHSKRLPQGDLRSSSKT